MGKKQNNTNKGMTKEQVVIAEMQKLQLSDGWKIIIESLKGDLIEMEGLLKQKAKIARTVEEISEVNYIANKIEFMEDMLTVPKRIINETEPMVKNTNPTEI